MKALCSYFLRQYANQVQKIGSQNNLYKKAIKINTPEEARPLSLTNFENEEEGMLDSLNLNKHLFTGNDAATLFCRILIKCQGSKPDIRERLKFYKSENFVNATKIIQEFAEKKEISPEIALKLLFRCLYFDNYPKWMSQLFKDVKVNIILSRWPFLLITIQHSIGLNLVLSCIVPLIEFAVIEKEYTTIK